MTRPSEIGRSVTSVVVLAFLLTLGVSWPILPLGAHLPDLLFIPLTAWLAVNGAARPALCRLDWLAAAYLAGSLPSLIVTPDLQSSLLELGRHAYVVAIYAAIALVVQRGGVRSVVAGMAASGLGVAMLGVAFALAFALVHVNWQAAGEAMKLPYAGRVLRLRALTATPAMLACLLTMAVPFAIAGVIRARHARPRLLWLGATAVMTTAAVMTFSHALAGFVVATLVAAWPALRDRTAWRRVAILVTVTVAIVCNLSIVASLRQVTVGGTVLADSTTYVYAVDEGTLSLGPVHVVYEVMSYLRLKELEWEAFREHPWTGVGLDQFHEVSERAYREGRLPVTYHSIDPHSSLLGALAETGLPGGLTLALLWAGLLVSGTRALRESNRDTWPARAALAGLAGLLVAGINVDIMNFRFFWAGLGLLRGWMALPPSRDNPTGSLSR